MAPRHPPWCPFSSLRSPGRGPLENQFGCRYPSPTPNGNWVLLLELWGGGGEGGGLRGRPSLNPGRTWLEGPHPPGPERVCNPVTPLQGGSLQIQPTLKSIPPENQHKELYTQDGILHILDRNKRIEPQPERFQNCRDLFDLILTCEESVYDRVLEDLNSREQETCQPVHIINVDIQDNHEEATLGAFPICELCQCIQHTEDVENEIHELLQEFQEKSGRAFLHKVCFY
ncbi:RNA polymerase II subunit A C-terminal domain phosphatase SSU72-like [Lontra canadensis]|uniref:RNA polymerase II subunit A C-terminal domain phosphatase SSU72-like n=1 Tax=Lontra canadensis TaxID=76717 RepID=UPI0013F308C4|nr:RNA polymerase II subunit A C-terminal domain phosphatase SSU72-like [Lontra canadensis]